MAALAFRSAFGFSAFIDLALYLILTGLGQNPIDAAVLSFIGSTVALYCWLLPGSVLFRKGTQSTIIQVIQLLTFSAMLLALRGGLLFILTTAAQDYSIVSFIPSLLLSVILHYIFLQTVMGSENDRSESYQTQLLFLMFFTVAIHLFFIGALELIPEEAYYWHYAKYLSPGYIDHPPMVGWLIALGVRIFGLNEFGVRIMALLSSLLAVAFVLGLHNRIFGKSGILFTAALTLAIPYIFGAGFFISPDAPLILFWSASLFFLHRALNGVSSLNWAMFGICIGLGMLSKYTIVLLGIPTVFLMAWVPQWRRWFHHSGPYIAVVLAALVFSPVIYWNAENEWASFVFQGPRRFNSTVTFSLHRYVLDMMYLVTPAILIAIVPAALWFRRLHTENAARINLLFCLACLSFPAAVFGYYSIQHVPKLNWSGPSFLAIMPLLGYWLHSLRVKHIDATRIEKGIARFCLPVIFLWLGLVALIIHYLGLGLPFIPYSEKMHRVIGWKSMSEAIIDVSNKVQASEGSQPVLVGMDKHTIASELGFYTAKRLGLDSAPQIGSRNIVNDEALMFRYWSPPENFRGKNLVLVAKTESDISDAKVSNFFERVGPIEKLSLTTRGHITKSYLYRIGYRYQMNQKGEDSEGELVVRPETPAPLLPEQVPQFAPSPPEINRS